MNAKLSLTAMILFSVPAIAVNNDSFYGRAGGGLYELETMGFDDRAPTLKILGGYTLNRIVSFEAGYTRLFETSSNIDGANIEIDGNVWDLSTRLSIPTGKRFDTYGRLGWSYVDLGAKVTGNGVQERFNAYDDAFAWAIGTGVNLSNRLALSGEYGQVQVSDGDLRTLTLTLGYRFGRS